MLNVGNLGHYVIRYPYTILLVGLDDYCNECINYTNLSSDIKTLYLNDIAECFTNISEKVRDAIVCHVLPKYGF